MIGAGAMLLQCRPRTSAFSEVPSRISMKSYLSRKKKTEEEIISCCFTMFLYRHPLENYPNTRLTLRLMPQERIKRNKIDEKGAAEGG